MVNIRDRVYRAQQNLNDLLVHQECALVPVVLRWGLSHAVSADVVICLSLSRVSGRWVTLWRTRRGCRQTPRCSRGESTPARSTSW